MSTHASALLPPPSPRSMPGLISVPPVPEVDAPALDAEFHPWRLRTTWTGLHVYTYRAFGHAEVRARACSAHRPLTIDPRARHPALVRPRRRTPRISLPAFLRSTALRAPRVRAFLYGLGSASQGRRLRRTSARADLQYGAGAAVATEAEG
ncbi:hypothetical protein DFH09DRAFT_1285003, partial [Mycena vulgaris]